MDAYPTAPQRDTRALVEALYTLGRAAHRTPGEVEAISLSLYHEIPARLPYRLLRRLIEVVR